MSVSHASVLEAVKRGNKTPVSVAIHCNGSVKNAARTLDRLYVKGLVIMSTETGNYYLSERGKKKMRVS